MKAKELQSEGGHQLAYCSTKSCASHALLRIASLALFGTCLSSTVSVPSAQGQTPSTPIYIGSCGPKPVSTCSAPPTCKNNAVLGGIWMPGAPYAKGTRVYTQQRTKRAQRNV